MSKPLSLLLLGALFTGVGAILELSALAGSSVLLTLGLIAVLIAIGLSIREPKQASPIVIFFLAGGLIAVGVGAFFKLEGMESATSLLAAGAISMLVALGVGLSRNWKISAPGR